MRQTRTRVIVLGLAVWILSAVIIGCGRSSEPPISCVGADNASTTKTLVGVIRFDTWPSNGVVADRFVRLLDPLQWHYRLPFFGRAIDGARVSMNGNTVAVMDQELAYMVSAGLKFMCFNHQITEMHGGIDAYRASTSPNKPLVKICMQESSVVGGRLTDTLAIMNAERANWLYVQGNRPVVFLQNFFNLITAPDLQAYRNAIMANGFANPYTICQHHDVSRTAAVAAQVGCDAISSYEGGQYGNPQFGAPYSNLVAATESRWDAERATGRKVVPTVMPGWDDRPGDNPPGRMGYLPTWWQYPTPTEIATHLQHALTWVAANPTVAETGLIQISAWNEIPEGHYIVPMNPLTNSEGAGRLNAIAAVLCARRPSAHPDSGARAPTGARQQE